MYYLFPSLQHPTHLAVHTTRMRTTTIAALCALLLACTLASTTAQGSGGFLSSLRNYFRPKRQVGQKEITIVSKLGCTKNISIPEHLPAATGV